MFEWRFKGIFTIILPKFTETVVKLEGKHK